VDTNDHAGAGQPSVTERAASSTWRFSRPGGASPRRRPSGVPSGRAAASWGEARVAGGSGAPTSGSTASRREVQRYHRARGQRARPWKV